ncbi:TetR family transcriptional regulator [Actinocorallia populi]|uniref:TetR family transcriptional regulator n=1 Tax=Actinocorallia populi TaxID=2079200 RepID=UPI000D095BB6|nr:TetR family transcriptional regulator [Actinocorallia populi]
MSVHESTRRRLSDRQADTVRRLTDATVAEVRETGYDGLTVRNVARRAGVAAATAYTYFTSKNHLLTEVFWRRLEALPRTDGDAAQALREIVLLIASEPELAAACTTAVLASDPDVRELRLRIGLNIHQRLVHALGREDGVVLDALEMAYSGALLQAGMGYMSYTEAADRLAEVARLTLR